MGTNQSSQRAPPAIQPPRPPPRQPYAWYKHIPSPTFDEMRAGAHIFDQISHQLAFVYAFDGGFGTQLLSGEVYQIYDLEIRIDQNDVPRLNNLMWDFPDHLAVTSTGQHIVVIRENTGIALQFSITGDAQGNALIPPRNSPARTALHGNSEATFSYCSLKYQENNRAVPVLRPRLLLKQRLLRFNPRAFEYLELNRMRRDADDIKALLKCTRQELSFLRIESNQLLTRVKEWIAFAENNAVLMSWEDVDEWRRLGFDLGFDSISKQLRGICAPAPAAHNVSARTGTDRRQVQAPASTIPRM